MHILGWDEEKVLACDRAVRDLAAIGIHLHVALTHEDHLPSVLPKRRLSGFRVSLDDVALYLTGMAGATAAEYAEALYKTHPWTDLAKEQARRKFIVAAKRLKDQGRLSEDRRADGQTGYGPAGWTRDAKPPSLDAEDAKALRVLSPMLGGDLAKAREVWAAVKRMRP